jgi:environmental stress-induced protein Ves
VSLAPERIDLRQRMPQPWKNGAGVTRELAVAPAGATMDGFDWRISIAEVARDAPFSAFPGVDRCIVLLDGAGMVLELPQRSHRLERTFEPFAFSGDEAVDARLIDGPTVDFNVMVRRGRWRAQVSTPSTQRAAPADAGLLLCWRGALRLQGGRTLPEQHACVWRDGLPAVSCEPASPATRALLVRLVAL